MENNHHLNLILAKIHLAGERKWGFKIYFIPPTPKSWILKSSCMTLKLLMGNFFFFKYIRGKYPRILFRNPFPPPPLPQAKRLIKSCHHQSY